MSALHPSARAANPQVTGTPLDLHEVEPERRAGLTPVTVDEKRLGSAVCARRLQQSDDAQSLDAAEAVAVAAEAGDIGAPFEPAALDVLRTLQERDFAAWVRLRARLKKAGVGVTELDRQLRGDQCGDNGDESLADRLVAMARTQCEFMHDDTSVRLKVEQNHLVRVVC